MPFAKPIPDDGRVRTVLEKMAQRWAPRSVLDVELLTVAEVAGILRMSTSKTYKFIRTLPEGAVVRSGHGSGNWKHRDNRRLLIHAWALGQLLNLQSCPGCGQDWPER
jgi:hypothetical protein